LGHPAGVILDGDPVEFYIVFEVDGGGLAQFDGRVSGDNLDEKG
jgi:hypothetical protein